MTYYGPDEPSSDIELERFFLAGDCLTGVGYGMFCELFSGIPCLIMLAGATLILYLATSHSLWQRRNSKPVIRYLLAYTTLLFSLSTIFTVVQAGTVQMMYIDNRNYDGGPWQYFLATQQLPINVLFIVCLFLLNLLADILFVSAILCYR